MLIEGGDLCILTNYRVISQSAEWRFSSLIPFKPCAMAGKFTLWNSLAKHLILDH